METGRWRKAAAEVVVDHQHADGGGGRGPSVSAADGGLSAPSSNAGVYAGPKSAAAVTNDVAAHVRSSINSGPTAAASRHLNEADRILMSAGPSFPSLLSTAAKFDAVVAQTRLGGGTTKSSADGPLASGPGRPAPKPAAAPSAAAVGHTRAGVTASTSSGPRIIFHDADTYHHHGPSSSTAAPQRVQQQKQPPPPPQQQHQQRPKQRPMPSSSTLSLGALVAPSLSALEAEAAAVERERKRKAALAEQQQLQQQKQQQQQHTSQAQTLKLGQGQQATQLGSRTAPIVPAGAASSRVPTTVKPAGTASAASQQAQPPLPAPQPPQLPAKPFSYAAALQHPRPPPPPQHSSSSAAPVHTKGLLFGRKADRSSFGLADHSNFTPTSRNYAYAVAVSNPSRNGAVGAAAPASHVRVPVPPWGDGVHNSAAAANSAATVALGDPHASATPTDDAPTATATSHMPQQQRPKTLSTVRTMMGLVKEAALYRDPDATATLVKVLQPSDLSLLRLLAFKMERKMKMIDATTAAAGSGAGVGAVGGTLLRGKGPTPSSHAVESSALGYGPIRLGGSSGLIGQKPKGMPLTSSAAATSSNTNSSSSAGSNSSSILAPIEAAVDMGMKIRAAEEKEKARQERLGLKAASAATATTAGAAAAGASKVSSTSLLAAPATTASTTAAAAASASNAAVGSAAGADAKPYTRLLKQLHRQKVVRAWVFASLQRKLKDRKAAAAGTTAAHAALLRGGGRGGGRGRASGAASGTGATAAGGGGRKQQMPPRPGASDAAAGSGAAAGAATAGGANQKNAQQKGTAESSLSSSSATTAAAMHVVAAAASTTPSTPMAASAAPQVQHQPLAVLLKKSTKRLTRLKKTLLRERIDRWLDANPAAATVYARVKEATVLQAEAGDKAASDARRVLREAAEKEIRKREAKRILKQIDKGRIIPPSVKIQVPGGRTKMQMIEPRAYAAALATKVKISRKRLHATQVRLVAKGKCVDPSVAEAEARASQAGDVAAATRFAADTAGAVAAAGRSTAAGVAVGAPASGTVDAASSLTAAAGSAAGTPLPSRLVPAPASNPANASIDADAAAAAAAAKAAVEAAARLARMSITSSTRSTIITSAVPKHAHMHAAAYAAPVVAAFSASTAAATASATRAGGASSASRAAPSSASASTATAASAAVAPATVTLNPRHIGGAAGVRTYVNQDLSLALDDICSEMISTSYFYQERARSEDPRKAMRRLVVGLREVQRGCKSGKIRMVIIAPNVDASASEGGLDEQVSTIIATAREHNVPVIFALSRRKIGTALGSTLRSCVVGFYTFENLRGLNNQALEMAARLRASWSARNSGGSVSNGSGSGSGSGGGAAGSGAGSAAAAAGVAGSTGASAVVPSTAPVSSTSSSSVPMATSGEADDGACGSGAGGYAASSMALAAAFLPLPLPLPFPAPPRSSALLPVPSRGHAGGVVTGAVDHSGTGVSGGGAAAMKKHRRGKKKQKQPQPAVHEQHDDDNGHDAVDGDADGIPSSSLATPPSDHHSTATTTPHLRATAVEWTPPIAVVGAAEFEASVEFADNTMNGALGLPASMADAAAAAAAASIVPAAMAMFHAPPMQPLDLTAAAAAAAAASMIMMVPQVQVLPVLVMPDPSLGAPAVNSQPVVQQPAPPPASAPSAGAFEASSAAGQQHDGYVPPDDADAASAGPAEPS